MSRTLLRFDLLDGRSLWRPLIDLEHATLCKQASLDPCSVYFDLPASARGIGSASSGYGGNRGTRKIEGMIMRGADRQPIGKITFATEGERFKDGDPRDPREVLRTGW
jgi:hypothetical protein